MSFDEVEVEQGIIWLLLQPFPILELLLLPPWYLLEEEEELGGDGERARVGDAMSAAADGIIDMSSARASAFPG